MQNSVGMNTDQVEFILSSSVYQKWHRVQNLCSSWMPQVMKCEEKNVRNFSLLVIMICGRFKQCTGGIQESGETARSTRHETSEWVVPSCDETTGTVTFCGGEQCCAAPTAAVYAVCQSLRDFVNLFITSAGRGSKRIFFVADWRKARVWSSCRKHNWK